MSANAPRAAWSAIMAPPDFADLDQSFLDYYEHRFDYVIAQQAELREDLMPEARAARAEAPRPLTGSAWLGTGV